MPEAQGVLAEVVSGNSRERGKAHTFNAGSKGPRLVRIGRQGKLTGQVAHGRRANQRGRDRVQLCYDIRERPGGPAGEVDRLDALRLVENHFPDCDPIIARTNEKQDVIAVLGDVDVILGNARTEMDPVDRGGAIAVLDDRILAVGEREVLGVGTKATRLRVVAHSSRQNVVAAAALQQVIAEAAIELRRRKPGLASRRNGDDVVAVRVANA